jgi:serine/threonine-protein kinase RsbW
MSKNPADEHLLEHMLELRLPSKLGYERIAIDTAASLARRMGFENAQVDALRTAVGEAVTNAIEHGNQYDETIRVIVALTARPDELIISVADQGRQPLDRDCLEDRPRIEDRFERTDRGGWGIWLIRELMDQVEFSTDSGGGNHVRMVIHLDR